MPPTPWPAVFAEHGPPLVLKSDNGSHFTGGNFPDLLAAHRVEHLLSPPYWPRYNGAVEAGIHALKDRYVLVHGERWAVYVGKNVSIAHDALVHGPCFVGDDTFIGFKAVVHDAIVGAGCFVGISAVVVGVELPEARYVPPGSVIDTQDKANALVGVGPEQRHFNADVVEVNRGLAVAYRENAHRNVHVRLDRDDQWASPKPTTENF